MNLNHCIRIGLFVGMLAVSPLSSRVQAQDKPHYTHANTRFDVDFSGGTVSSYIDQIRKASADGAANIVVMPEAKTLPVPPIKLVAVTAQAAIQILEGPYRTAGGLRAEIRVDSYDIGDSPDMVMKVIADVEMYSIRSAVWSVEEALARGQTAEELLGAVEAVVALFHNKAEISFHPPTRLLIARGNSEQLDLVREALSQLIDGARRRQDELSIIRDRIDSEEAGLYRTKAELSVSIREFEATSVVFDRITKGMNDGLYSPDDHAQHQIQMARAEAEMLMRRHDIARIEAKLKSLRDNLKRYESEKE